jgi:predicted DCC family thiol-disulfide oxidoreductase YuxK
VTRVPILYDADCGFCRVSAALVLAWDRRRRLRPVAIQEPEGQRLLGDVPAERRLDSWHLVDPAGKVRSAGGAFAPLFRLLPGGAPLAALAERFPRGAERSYFFVADRRSPIGQRIPAAVKRWADRAIASRRL